MERCDKLFATLSDKTKVVVDESCEFKTSEGTTYSNSGDTCETDSEALEPRPPPGGPHSFSHEVHLGTMSGKHLEKAVK